jgi:heat-inducible transcriptional repressor
MAPTRQRELSDRKAAILRALVRHYVRTGEPVGSEIIAGSSSLGVSPATIRNELAALEEMGYLTQPHTSAGRAPTDLGYRYFVDSLPGRQRLREQERQAIVHFFDEALSNVDEILRGTTQLLSRLTRYASLALAPRLRESAIVQAELVALGSGTLLLLVFDNGRVEKRIVEKPSGARDRDVERAFRAIVVAVRGKTLQEARESVSMRTQAANEPVERDLLTTVGEALNAIDEAAEAEHVLLGGVANIAAEEAFHRGEKLREIFETLERESEVLTLLRQAAAQPPVSVTIGRENPVTGMWEASMVAAPFTAGDRAIGTIGVVGPTRMDYASAISAVRAVAERLSAAVEALGG